MEPFFYPGQTLKSNQSMDLVIQSGSYSWTKMIENHASRSTNMLTQLGIFVAIGDLCHWHSQ